jgi:hypothetical protein
MFNSSGDKRVIFIHIFNAGFFMNKILLHSAKVLSIGLLLSMAPIKGMAFNDLNEIDTLERESLGILLNSVNASEKNVGQSSDVTAPATQTKEIVKGEVKVETKVESSSSSSSTTPTPVQKVEVKETSTQASNPAPKTESPATGSTKNVAVKDPVHGVKAEIVPANNDVKPGANAAKEVAKDAKLTGIRGWLASLAAKKDNTATYLKEFRARGWGKWTTTERAVVVATTVAVTALVTYGAYRLYEAYTKEDNKKNKRAVRRAVRA